MNLRHLRAFAEVVRTGSVAAASATAHLSQPAISQALSKLETGLGVKLFVRSNRGMSPTEPAVLLHRRAERALAGLGRGAAAAAGRANARRRTSFETAFTTTQLKALIAVATHGNFTLAARAAGRSQPSLHRAVRDLEKVAGFRLLAKSAGGFEPTPAATHLLGAAKLAFSEIDRGIEDIGELTGTGAGRIAIGAMPLARSAILPAAIGRLLAERPDTVVRVVDGPYPDLLSGLLQGDLDIMLGALRDPNPSGEVCQRTLFRDRLGVFSGPDRPFTGRQPDPRELARRTWIVPGPATPTRVHFDRFFGTRTGAPPARLVETSSMILVRGLLASGERLAVLSRAQAAEEVGRGGMVELAVDLDDAPRRIGMTCRADWRPTRTQARFIEILEDVTGTRKEA